MYTRENKTHSLVYMGAAVIRVYSPSPISRNRSQIRDISRATCGSAGTRTELVLKTTQLSQPVRTERMTVARIEIGQPLWAGDESPSTVTAELNEWPDDITLPLALAFDINERQQEHHCSPHRLPSTLAYSASRKAAGRQDTPLRPTNDGQSAAEVWGQSLAEWRANGVSKWAAGSQAFPARKPVVRKPTSSGPTHQSVSSPRPRADGAGVTPPASGNAEEQLVQLVDACVIGGAHCSLCNLWCKLRAGELPRM